MTAALIEKNRRYGHLLMVTPDELDTGWYRSVGSGMGATLNTASGMGAYVMSDRASWLKFNNKGDLTLLYAGDPVLFNQYAYLPLDPKRHPHVDTTASAALETMAYEREGTKK